MSWDWEYEPDQASVVGGAPEAFIARVEIAVAEVVRAAEALYLDGTLYEGPIPARERPTSTAACSCT